MPILVAPVAYQRLVDSDGELGMARAAAAAGTVMCLSTLATTRPSEVAEAVPGGRHWFQLYAFRDAGVTRALMEEAVDSGFEAVLVTVDAPRGGRRERDLRTGFKIPEGTENGGTIRVPGKGGAGARGGAVGDLFVTVRVLPHPYFERHGNDIQGVVPITVKEAYAGAELPVPTIHGVVTAKIPPGTQGRQRFRLLGKGVKDPRTGATGDHIYVVRIMIPKPQTPAGLDAATLLDSLYEGDVRAELPKGL